MTLFIICLSVLVLGSYLTMGRLLGLNRAPQVITEKVESNKRDYSYSARKESEVARWIDQARHDAAEMVWAYTFLWPFLIVAATVDRWDQRAISGRDPYLRDQLLKDQQKRIAELERELGMR